MLPGFRFLLAAILLSMSIVIFGLGAAALLRAAHEEVASVPTRRVMAEPVFAHQVEAPQPTLALLRVEPAVPEKAPDAAIRIAAKAGMKLRIAAKVDKVDQDYFAERIEPLLAQPHVEFLGEISEGDKSEFLGKAAGLLFPIAWREPFGLVMIEAMASGTPVVAFRDGSVPEVIEEGVTGYVVDSEDQAAAAARRLHSLDRARIRRVFEERFTARRMAEDYLKLYRRLIARQRPLQEAV